MRDKITYEWVFEEIENEEGDIVDPLFSKTLREALDNEPEDDNHRVDIALVRFEGNDEDGLNVREYAYLKNESLPVEFKDGYKIPKRFHKEVADVYCTN